MPTISSYALQYSDVNFTTISSSTFDLFITEGAPLAPGGGFPALSDTQVGQLQAQGRTVVGYVNVAVTDDARYYWNSGLDEQRPGYRHARSRPGAKLAPRRRCRSISTASPGRTR